MSKAIKLIVSGFESSGKSSITSKIQDVLVINFDQKEYSFEAPHANYTNYSGMDSVINFINEKLQAYKTKFKKFPKVIVFDTITHLYLAMTKYNSEKYTGFNIHSANSKDTFMFNSYINDVLVPNDVSVVEVAHTVFDESTSTFRIPGQGEFKRNGGWLSTTNEAIYIEKKNGKLNIYVKSDKYPARTTLAEYTKTDDKGNHLETEIKFTSDEFNFTEYLDKLMNSKVEIEKFVL